jgi:hypothetical protein
MPSEMKSEAHGLPHEVDAIRAEIKKFYRSTDAGGRPISTAKHGVYAFFDYDEEPIYAGQTVESLSTRINRHLTNQRTDAVAMNVLDPFEVAFIEVWPMDDLTKGLRPDEVNALMNKAEYTVYSKVLADSKLGAILNEKTVFATELITLPPSVKGCIIPADIFPLRKHPDIRLARRAATIANLARVISERDVSDGLRTTLLTQARRLELLASERLRELGISGPPGKGI